MDAIPLQEDRVNNGTGCCNSDQDRDTSLGLLQDNENKNATQKDISLRRPARRAPLSSRMHSSLRVRSNNLTSMFTNSNAAERIVEVSDHENEVAGYVSPTNAAPLADKECFDEEPRTEPVTRSMQLYDKEEGSDNIHSNSKDDTDSMCSETCPVDALAIGIGAHEYLEECFYTEVSVLDEEKFNAIPEILKSDLTIMEHIGKGSFCDVFEVVQNGERLVDVETSNGISADTQPKRRRFPLSGSITKATLARPSARGMRASLSRSITTATLVTHSQCEKRNPVFAMKCLRPQIRSDADQFTIGAEDLIHETAILSTLNHPNIIKLHGHASGNLSDAFVCNDGYFILLDRLTETFVERMMVWKQNPKCFLQRPTANQIKVARSIADAVSYLHSKNIVFRDLKPDNIGFDSTGTLKLFDFGLAIGLPEKDDSNPDGLLFDRCGTPRYMAPEVGLSLGYDVKADVYSFGILLWEICALTKPFSFITSAIEFERTVYVGGKRPVNETYWPTTLKELIISCWSCSPDKRPTDWVAIKSSLSSIEKKFQMRSIRSRITRKCSDQSD